MIVLKKKKKEKEIQNINVTSFHYAKQNYGDGERT